MENSYIWMNTIINPDPFKSHECSLKFFCRSCRIQTCDHCLPSSLHMHIQAGYVFYRLPKLRLWRRISGKCSFSLEHARAVGLAFALVFSPMWIGTLVSWNGGVRIWSWRISLDCKRMSTLLLLLFVTWWLTNHISRSISYDSNRLYKCSILG